MTSFEIKTQVNKDIKELIIANVIPEFAISPEYDFDGVKIEFDSIKTRFGMHLMVSNALSMCHEVKITKGRGRRKGKEFATIIIKHTK